MKKEKKIKAWAVVSRGGLLVGGGSKEFGYFPLCVYRTRQGAKEGKSPTRPTDKIVRCEIKLKL